MKRLLLTHSPFELDGTRIIHFLKTSDLVVSNTVDVDPLVLIEVSTSHIAVKRNQIRVLIVHSFNHIEPVRHKVRMCSPPLEQLDLLHTDKPREIIHLRLRVGSISLQPGEIKQFGTIIDLLPEALLHALLSAPQKLVHLEVV